MKILTFLPHALLLIWLWGLANVDGLVNPTLLRNHHLDRHLLEYDRKNSNAIGHSMMRFPKLVNSKLSSLNVKSHDLLDEPVSTLIDSEHSAAKRALEKLRRRQKSDLEETERMIDILDGNHNKLQQNPEVHSASLSTAASFLSGADYGFISRSEGPPPTLKGALVTKNYGPPSNFFTLGSQQFMRNWRAILGEYSDEPSITLSSRQMMLQSKLKELTLNSTEIWERENVDGPIEAPLIIKAPYLAICFLLDVVFEGSYVPSRFFLLETVARMPYFSYISMLHLYETLGFWRRSSEAKRIHFAEELNEYAHLLIMESLGGDQTWWVRFVAQHSAIVYYFVLCGLFAISPSLSYKFSELLETHAVNTYSVFMDNNRDLLKELPPSNAAVNYYSLGISDPFYAEFQSSTIVGHEVRRPGERMQSLLDVFAAIAADEGDHVSAMSACLDTKVTFYSPSVERRILVGVAAVAVATYLLSTSGVFDAGFMDSADTAVSVTTDATAVTEVAAATAGVMGWAEEMIKDDEGNIESVGEGLIEGGGAMSEMFRRAGLAMLKFVSRLL